MILCQCASTQLCGSRGRYHGYATGILDKSRSWEIASHCSRDAQYIIALGDETTSRCKECLRSDDRVLAWTHTSLPTGGITY